MDNENLQQIASLAKVILSKLEHIGIVTSVKQLVVVFQELVVKLVQFSSKIHEVKKISKDEFQRKNLKSLLRSIKDSIPELSQACKDSLSANNYELFRRKEHIIKKLVYTVEAAETFLKEQTPSDYLKLQYFSRKPEFEDDDPLPKGQHFAEIVGDIISNSSSPSLSGSTTLSECTTFSQCDSLQPHNIHGRFDFQSLSMNYRKIHKQIKELIEDQEILSYDEYKKQDFGKKLINDIDEFISTAEALEHITAQGVTILARRCNNLRELGLDFVSMVMDYSNSETPEDDFKILLNIQSHLEKQLNGIIEIVQKSVGKEGMLIVNELEAGEVIEELTNYAMKRNFIGLADATALFFEKCEDSKRILKEMLGTSFQEHFQSFERKFQTDLPDIECILNELIENIEDRKTLQLLINKMRNFLALLSSCRELLPAKSSGKIQHDSFVEKGPGDESRKEKEKSSFSMLIDQFAKAINENDYKTVEILANRFLSNVKLIGELLQGITPQAYRDIRDLHHLFAKYFKTAGGFCSKARKAVLSDIDDEASIDSVVNTANEMEEMKNKFLNRCKLSLRPWLDVSTSILHGKPTKTSLNILNIAQRLRLIIEDLSDTEYMEQNSMKSKLRKLSNIITKTTDSIASTKMRQGRDDCSSNGFLLEMYGLQWTCAVINILEVVDRASVSCLHFDSSSMNNEKLLGTTRTWLSMLQTLSLCCTDPQGTKEISKINEQLTSICKKLKTEQNVEDFGGKVDLAILRRELFSSILLAMELTDILTQSVREPMRGYIDPLASLSFAPNLQSYIDIRDSFHDKMETVHMMSCLAVQDSAFRSKAHQVFVAADELKEISENLLSTVKSSKDKVKEKLYFLKLRWRLTATYLIKALLSVPEANYTAVAGVMRHLQSASHNKRYDELIAVLKDIGSKKGFCKDAWKLNIEPSTYGSFMDEISIDLNSTVNSILDYSNSWDTNVLTESSPRIESPEATFFQNYSSNLKEDSAPSPPLFRTPDTFNPQSSFSSTRSSSSQDTEIFVPKATKRAYSAASKDPKGNADSEGNGAVAGAPFPGNLNGASWQPSSTDDQDGPVIVTNESKISQSISAAALILMRELEEWEEDENSIITVVKKMTTQMLDMAEYAKGKGELKNKEDFIHTAKAIAANAKLVAKFAIIIADYCLDETCRLNLLDYAEIVPTLSTQLNIIASVKAATPNDETADAMLIANAENLMRSVSGTLNAAESASVKMKSGSETENREPRGRTAALAVKWKKKLDFRRSMESLTAPRNELGLKIIRDGSPWSMTDL